MDRVDSEHMCQLMGVFEAEFVSADGDDGAVDIDGLIAEVML
jgi:hypothetical protein